MSHHSRSSSSLSPGTTKRVSLSQRPPEITNRSRSVGSYSIEDSRQQQQQQQNRSSTQQQQQQPRIYFLSALATIPVPNKLLEGIEVVIVEPNGKTKMVLLSISVDRFTVYLRPLQDLNKVNNTSRSTGFFSRRSVSASSSSIGTTTTTTSNGFGGIPLPPSAGFSITSSTATTANNNSEIRAIDIGEMARIQRGQSTQQFEFAKKNVDKFEIVLRRTELLRRQSSAKSIGPGSVILIPETGSGSSITTTTTTTALQSSSPTQQPSAATTKAIQQLDPNLSFSIIFRGTQTLDLMVCYEQDREEICDSLDRILKAYQRGKTRVSTDVLLLRYIWLDIDKEKTGYITCTQVNKVLHAINFAALKPRDVNTAYEKFGKVIGLDRSKRKHGLTLEQSATFLHKIKRDSWMVKPVSVIWNELFGEIMNNGKQRLTVSDKTFLDNFFRTKQGQTASTLVDVRKIFTRLHDMEFAHTTTAEPIKDIYRINRDQFEAHLLANENDAFDPDMERFRPEDMNQPLSEYWISSSHNTYLIGDQYTSHSSVEMYSNALYRGARCLELDIWDGGRAPDGTPIPVVWHGHTMTTKILFVEIIKTIKVFLNFHPDTFPIILSFENHCSIPFQVYMAEQLTRILDDALYVPTEASLFGPLPSPARIRGMVVIKGRRPLGTEADQYDSDDYYDEGDEEGTAANSSISGALGDSKAASKEAREKVVKHGVAPELASLTLLNGTKLKTFEESMRTRTYYMHSFSENQVRSLCRQKKSNAWIAYNQTHLSRTYPAGSRLDSSNYNPLLAWSTGCQMVALNFQTQDVFLKLNDGRFRENGNCGYVLKPSSLMIRDNNKSQRTRGARLTIRVLSGNCIPKPNGSKNGDCIDPYVKVAVYDVNSDEKETITQYSTGPVPANGYFPIWGQEKFTFSIENWAVAMLQVTVYDKQKEEFIASSSIPISCLRRGIRCVKLYDATNTRSGAFDFASLLLDIKMGQKVAEI